MMESSVGETEPTPVIRRGRARSRSGLRAVRSRLTGDVCAAQDKCVGLSANGKNGSRRSFAFRIRDRLGRILGDPLNRDTAVIS
jgi:hypothetical protein